MPVFTITLFTFFSCKNKTGEITETKAPKTHYYFVRHAEKDRSDPNDTNPKLTHEGLLRAKALSTILNGVTIDAVYSSYT